MSLLPEGPWNLGIMKRSLQLYPGCVILFHIFIDIFPQAHTILRRAGESCGLTASHAQKQGIAQAAKEAAAVAKAKADKKAPTAQVTPPPPSASSEKHQENAVKPKPAAKEPAIKPAKH